MSARAIEPPGAPLDARVRPPGSKSITNRALVVAALARGTSELDRRARERRHARDGRGAARARAAVDADGTRTARHRAAPARCRPAPAALHVGNAGTAARFLPPLLALGAGPYALDGVPRMRERPIAPLLDALAALGARVEHARRARATCPCGSAAAASAGGASRVSGDVSSQFLSGLLLSAPGLPVRPARRGVAGRSSRGPTSA